MCIFFLQPELAAGSFGRLVPAILSAGFCFIGNFHNFKQKVIGHVHFCDSTNKHLFPPLPDTTLPFTPAGPEGAAHATSKDSNSRDIPSTEG